MYYHDPLDVPSRLLLVVTSHEQIPNCLTYWFLQFPRFYLRKLDLDIDFTRPDDQTRSRYRETARDMNLTKGEVDNPMMW